MNRPVRKILPLSFFDRPTLAVARGLLGKYLVRKYRGRTRAVMITEVEAYDGPRDRASHASRGRTPRNAPMFGEAGHFYVYFTYGMHWLVNVVTGPRDYPAAVLLRGGVYRARRVGERDPRDGHGPSGPRAHRGPTRRLDGPARLTKFLHIDRAQNGKPASRKVGIWFEDRGEKIPRSKIIARKRVGVDYAGSVWSDKKYNFRLSSDKTG